MMMIGTGGGRNYERDSTTPDCSSKRGMRGGGSHCSLLLTITKSSVTKSMPVVSGHVKIETILWAAHSVLGLAVVFAAQLNHQVPVPPLLATLNRNTSAPQRKKRK